jgi:DNA-binding transcriptional regulator YiaG
MKKNKIKFIREEKLIMTQAQFAKAIGCTQTTVTRWECRHYMPSSTNIKKIIALAKKKGMSLLYGDIV